MTDEYVKGQKYFPSGLLALSANNIDNNFCVYVF